MSMETLEFIIYPDGRVLEKVTGIVGPSCEEVTKAIERQLGKVISTEKTAEYFNQSLEANHQTTKQLNTQSW